MVTVMAATAPTPPDFHICDKFFGRIGVQQCLLALNEMPTGAEPVNWEIVNPASESHTPYHMPITWAASDLGCYITLDPVALNMQATGETISMAPDRFREMAGWVINQCTGRYAAGGYITANISSTIDYLVNQATHLNQDPPATSFFYTITIKGSESRYRLVPGCRDPAIAGVLYEGVRGAQDTRGDSSLSNLLRILGANWEHMHRGSYTAWYRGLRTITKTTTNTPANKDNNGEMAYTCDARLGKPSQTDCSQLQYSQLGPPSDTITILAGGPPKTLRSGTCTVAISTTTTDSIVLSWAQIIAAVGTLIEICVDNPLGTAQGGTAVAGTQQSLLDLRPGFSTSSSGGNLGRRRRRRDVSGFDALPRGVNVTVSGPG